MVEYVNENTAFSAYTTYGERGNFKAACLPTGQGSKSFSVAKNKMALKRKSQKEEREYQA